MDKAKLRAEMEKEEKHQALLDRVVDALDKTRHFRNHELAYQRDLAEAAAERARKAELEHIHQQRMIEMQMKNPPPPRNARKAQVPKNLDFLYGKKTERPSWNVSRKLVVPKPSPVVKGRQYAAQALSAARSQRREPSPPPEPESLTPERQMVRDLISDQTSPYWTSNPSTLWGNAQTRGNFSTDHSTPKSPYHLTNSRNPGLQSHLSRATPRATDLVFPPFPSNLSHGLNRVSKPGPSRGVPATYVQSILMSPEYQLWKETADARKNEKKTEKIAVRDTRAGVNLVPGIAPPPKKTEGVTATGMSSKHPATSLRFDGRIERFLLDPRVPPMSLPKPRTQTKNQDSVMTSSAVPGHSKDFYPFDPAPGPSKDPSRFDPLPLISYQMRGMIGEDNVVVSRPSRPTSLRPATRDSSLTSTALFQHQRVAQSGLRIPEALQEVIDDIKTTLCNMTEDIFSDPSEPQHHDHDEMEENKEIRRRLPRSPYPRTPLPVQPKTSDTYLYGFACYTKSGSLVDSNTSLQSNVYPSPGPNNQFKMTVKHEKPWTPPQETQDTLNTQVEMDNKPPPSVKASSRPLPKAKD